MTPSARLFARSLECNNLSGSGSRSREPTKPCSFAWVLLMACVGSRFSENPAVFRPHVTSGSLSGCARACAHSGVGSFRSLPPSELTVVFATSRFVDLENPHFEPPPPPIRPLSPRLRAFLDSFFKDQAAEVSGHLQLAVRSPPSLLASLAGLDHISRGAHSQVMYL